MSMALLLAMAVGAQVELRGQESAPPGEIASIDRQGVRIGDAFITWDRVRAVGSDAAPAAEPFRADADRAWRARARLERGDAPGAEPLFEDLFALYSDERGPTTAVIAEGLLRCRLRRGAHIAAVEPWLVLLSCRAAAPGTGTRILHEAWATEAGLAPVIDPETGLAPALPPIWLGWPSVQAFGRAGGPSEEAADPTAVLRRLYLASAAFESGVPVEGPRLGVSDRGVELAWQIVRSRVGNAEQRETARRSLRDRLAANPPAWVEAWCRAAMGRSMIREGDEEQRRLGIIELLHVPARFGALHPYLAGTALAEAAVALRELGDAAGADRLLNELQKHYPNHPVMDWEPIRVLSSGEGAGHERVAALGSPAR